MAVTERLPGKLRIVHRSLQRHQVQVISWRHSPHLHYDTSTSLYLQARYWRLPHFVVEMCLNLVPTSIMTEYPSGPSNDSCSPPNLFLDLQILSMPPTLKLVILLPQVHFWGWTHIFYSLFVFIDKFHFFLPLLWSNNKKRKEFERWVSPLL